MSEHKVQIKNPGLDVKIDLLKKLESGAVLDRLVGDFQVTAGEIQLLLDVVNYAIHSDVEPLNAAAVSSARDYAKLVFKGNCTFVDDDISNLGAFALRYRLLVDDDPELAAKAEKLLNKYRDGDKKET